MGITQFPHGIASFGVPVLGSGSLTTTGNIFFVHNTNGNDGNDGTDPSGPFKTLDYAIGKCTASQGDIIVMMPGSNESITSTIALDVAGVSIIGIGQGAARPKLTQATTGSDNVLEVTAANCLIENIYFKGSTTGTSETFIDLAAAADNTTIRGCVFEQNTKNLNAIVVTVGCDYLTVEDCQFLGVADGPNFGIFFKNATSGATLKPTIRRCMFNYGPNGCDDACIGISMSSGTCTGILIQDCTFLGLVDGERAVGAKMQAGTTSNGLMQRVAVVAADATDVFVNASNALGFIDVYAVEAGKRPYGAVSGSGMLPQATTAA